MLPTLVLLAALVSAWVVLHLVAERMERELLGPKRIDWGWALRSAVLGLLLALGPLILYELATRGSVDLDREFRGAHLLMLLAGAAAFGLVYRWRIRHYRCRGCGDPLAAQGPLTARFRCGRCDMTWDAQPF